MAQVHPDVAAVLAAGRAAGAKPFEVLGVTDARLAHAARRVSHQLPAEPVAERIDFTVPGPAGAIPLRRYRPVGFPPGAILPALVFLHGGGWVLGSLDSHDALCCRLANAAGCCVVAVDYRLAPEHVHPAAIDDCAAAYAAVIARAREFGIDPVRVAVGGDSAGGNLAAAIALMGRDGALPPPIQQTLIYPAVDLDQDLDDYGPNTPGMAITGATMVWFRDLYVPDAVDRTDWRVSPIRAASLAGVAPALVIVCGHDPLAAEGRAYADRLVADGVTVTRLELPAQTHGMITMTRVIPFAAALQDLVAATLRDAFVVRTPEPQAAGPPASFGQNEPEDLEARR